VTESVVLHEAQARGPDLMLQPSGTCAIAGFAKRFRAELTRVCHRRLSFLSIWQIVIGTSHDFTFFEECLVKTSRHVRSVFNNDDQGIQIDWQLGLVKVLVRRMQGLLRKQVPACLMWASTSVPSQSRPLR
jgi:hypothetical protein